MSKPERRKGKETEEKSEVKAQVPSKKESTEKKEEKVVYEIDYFALVKRIILLVAVGITISSMYNYVMVQQFQSEEQPGLLLNLGGNPINPIQRHFYCIGQGNPTVVFLSDVGAGYYVWGSIQRIVSQFTKACTFDRKGFGYSNDVDSKVNSSKELHDILQRAGAIGPYILVGQGIGSLNAIAFAEEYSKEVTGMLLIDPITEKTLTYENGIYSGVLDKRKSAYGIYAITATLGLNRVLGALNLIPEYEAIRALPKEEQRVMKNELNRNGFWNARISEIERVKEQINEFSQKGYSFEKLLPEQLKTKLIKGVIFTPVQEMDLANRAWNSNLMYFQNLLPDGNIQRISFSPNIMRNDIANEVADEIRRIFGGARKEDYTQWTILTSDGVQKAHENEEEVSHEGHSHSHAGHSHGHSHEHSHGHSHSGYPGYGDYGLGGHVH